MKYLVLFLILALFPKPLLSDDCDEVFHMQKIKGLGDSDIDLIDTLREEWMRFTHRGGSRSIYTSLKDIIKSSEVIPERHLFALVGNLLTPDNAGISSRKIISDFLEVLGDE